MRLDCAFDRTGEANSAIMVREYLHLEIPFDGTWVNEFSDRGVTLYVEWGEFINLREAQLRRYRYRFGKQLGRWRRLVPGKKRLL